MRRHGSPQTLERVRQTAVSLRRQGVHPQQIAAALNRHVNTVYRWLSAVREDGVEALAARPHPGAALKLSMAQRARLTEQLLAGARAHGFSTDLWTAPRVQRLLREQYGVEYHVNYIPTLLRKLHFTPHKPETRARERNEAEIAHWRECDWPRIKKKAHRQGAVIVFWDETGFLMLPTVQRTWAPRGDTPVLWHQLKHHRRLSAIGMITVSPQRRRLGCDHFLWPDDAISDAVIVAVLRQMRRHFRRPVILLWDRLASHRSAFVQSYLVRTPDLDVEYFPAYAPELNPVEALWADTKQHDLAQFCPHDLQELEHAADESLDRKTHDQHRIAGYIREAELPMKLTA